MDVKELESLLLLVNDSMNKAVDSFPDSAKIDVLWAGMKIVKGKLEDMLHDRTHQP